MLSRPRRNRKSAGMRAMARESFLTASNLVLPLFLQEGEKQRTPIAAVPGQARLSVDLAVELAREAFALGVPAGGLFSAPRGDGKGPCGCEILNRCGLV